MSHINRSGTNTYNKHVGSRGSLSEIQNGRVDDYFDQSNSSEDREWEMRVLASAVTMYDSVTSGYNDDDYFEDSYEIYTSCGNIKNLWGIYHRGSCPHLKIGFDEDNNGKSLGCFRRAD